MHKYKYNCKTSFPQLWSCEAVVTDAAADLMLAVVHAAAALLPAPLKPDVSSPVPVVTGGDTANVLFGKLQRAAALPGSRLSPNPVASVDAKGRLSSVLWSQFMMSNVPAQDLIEPEDLPRSRRVEQSLVFIDCTTTEGGGGLPNPFDLFGKKKPKAQVAGAAKPVDVELLKLAQARGAKHTFVLVEGSAVRSCFETLSSLQLCATIIAPEDGVELKTTSCAL